MTDAIHLSNNAPLMDAEAIANRHKAAFVLSTAVLNAEAALPATVETDADLEALTKHAKDAASVKKTLDAARDTEKRPFDDAAKAVQGLFKPRLDKLDATRKVALDRITAHNHRLEEQRRKEAAEAAQREREEAQRRAEAAAQMETMGLDDVGAAIMDTAIDAERMADKMERVSTGSAADLVRTHTSAGAVTSATEIAFEIVDGDALRASLGALGAHFNQAHIEQAVRAYRAFHKKQGRGAADMSLPGVRFFATSSARVR
ncbi:hypothetical protein [uncultured Hyphomicrobium sp.]|uniref:hypothetical protein n=1 Tax=uncultured Hyphomicrobium sp. TaxID=194373 RepID=UPI0025F4448B|nr:hypothetical protein [uncultured Hyphomicrobium sp.]